MKIKEKQEWLGYKGVTYSSKRGAYYASLWINYERRKAETGPYNTQLEAAKAYDDLIKKYYHYDNIEQLNFPGDGRY